MGRLYIFGDSHDPASQIGTTLAIMSRFKPSCKSMILMIVDNRQFRIASLHSLTRGWNALQRLRLNFLPFNCPHLRKALEALPQLTSLSLTNFHATELIFPKMPNLTRLTLGVQAPNNDYVQTLSLKPFPKLKSIKLRGSSGDNQPLMKWSLIECESSCVDIFEGVLCRNVDFMFHVAPKIKAFEPYHFGDIKNQLLNDMQALKSLMHLTIFACPYSSEEINELKKFVHSGGVIAVPYFNIQLSLKDEIWTVDARGLRDWKFHRSLKNGEATNQKAKRYMQKFFQMMHIIAPYPIVQKADSIVVSELLEEVNNTFHNNGL